MLGPRALVGPAAKVLVTGDDRFLSFDLTTDPLERMPQPVGDQLRGAIDAHADAMQVGEVAPPVELDQATRERLRAAGYVIDQDGTAPPLSGFPVWNLLSRPTRRARLAGAMVSVAQW